LPQPWERQSGEPLKAYGPFLIYLNMGARRSLDSAYTLFCAENQRQNRAKTAPGHWSVWQRRYSWVKRVEARADYLAQQEFEALENEMRELAVRRQRREISSQAVVEGAADALAGKIKKLLDHPSVNVSSEKVDPDGNITRNKVGALRPGEIAKLSKEWREMEATAIHGHVQMRKTIRVDDTPAEANGQVVEAQFIPSPPPWLGKDD
jgi:hypothetical protein